MSYNGYNSYQPYYNQQRTSDASDQYGCQYTSGQGYQRTPYTTPQANVNGQQSHPPSQPSHYSTSTYGEPSRYTGVDSSGTAAYQNPRNDYGYAHGVRSPENTTALGSLAYASSLRQDRSGSGAHQDGDSLQRVADYNRATSSYAGAQRSENRSNGVSYSDYSAPNNRSERADSHYHSSSHGTPHYSQAAPQNTPYPSSLPSVGQQKSTYKPPSRPSSGQNIRQPRSLSSTTSNQSPRPSSNSRYPPPEVQQNQTRTPTPQHLQQSHRSAWAGSSVTGHGGPHPERQPSSTKSGNNPSQPAQLESRTSSSNIQSNGRSDADRSLRLPSIHGAPQDRVKGLKTLRLPTTPLIRIPQRLILIRSSMSMNTRRGKPPSLRKPKPTKRRQRRKYDESKRSKQRLPNLRQMKSL